MCALFIANFRFHPTKFMHIFLTSFQRLISKEVRELACFHFNTKEKSTQHASVIVTTDLGVQGPSITMRINSGITVPLKGPGAIG